MEEKVFAAALAGLLHDVGKVVQRAKDDPWRAPSDTPTEGQPVHAAWSLDFIKSIPIRRIAGHGAYHHQPQKSQAGDKSLSILIALADKLSAGERADELPEEKGSKPPRQLVSIFNRIGAHLERRKLDYQYFPLSKLGLTDQSIFPANPIEDSYARAAYENLAKNLEACARQDSPDPETYLENLMSGFQQYTWCVPSAYYHSLPDVSLYDHSRMTAALAVCLQEKSSENINQLLDVVWKSFSGKANKEELKLLDEPVALLMGGDISGIQSFIYMLSARGAARTLRGRSLYLQLLTEAVLRYTLRKLGIPYTNVIYSGGGHFYLLAPLSAKEKIPDLRQEITLKLLRHHGISLYLALGATEVPASGFRIGEFPGYWDSMHAELSLAKQRRYQELGQDMYNMVFKPSPSGGNREKSCSVCGEEKEGIQALDSEEGGRICDLCRSFGDSLGRNLPRARFIRLFLGEPEMRQPGSAADALAELGMGIQFISKEHNHLTPEPDLSSKERCVAWALDDPIQGWPKAGIFPESRWLHYMVNQIPGEDLGGGFRPKTFDSLQKDAKGIPRLGVLRMDVDNLGMLFKNGFSRNDTRIATLARVSSLSFQISLFFEGWVKRICEQESDLIYAVYSGGDDLFLIAPWHIVPRLAQKISDEFIRYTCGNPDLHISGGMAFIHGKYPVYQAAEDAKEALDQAKDQPGKAAFSFLGKAWKWDVFKSLAQKQQHLVELIERKDCPHSLLQNLQWLAQLEEKKASRSKRPVWGRWIWIGHYQLKRMIEKQKENATLKNELEKIYEAVKPFNENIDQWGTASRWAQLLIRKKGNG